MTISHQIVSMRVVAIAILILAVAVAGCTSASPDTTFEFDEGPQGWVEGFADYPADGEDRLANTAASIIDLRKDIVQSDRLQDHETLGVIDPRLQ